MILPATPGYRSPVTEQGSELRRRFHQELDEIDAKVIRLFALVTESVAAATDALLAGDVEAARELSRRDSLVDQLEVDLEQVAERELLMQTPMAGDMRYLVSVLRVVPELERSGDLAEHIAQRAAAGLAGRLTPTVRGLLEQMGTICVDLWRRAADAWAERDSEVAAQLDVPTTGSTTSTTSSSPSWARPTSRWPTPSRPRSSRGSTSGWGTTPSTSPSASATSPRGDSAVTANVRAHHAEPDLPGRRDRVLPAGAGVRGVRLGVRHRRRGVRDLRRGLVARRPRAPGDLTARPPADVPGGRFGGPPRCLLRCRNG